jgi:hypothetical protein
LATQRVFGPRLQAKPGSLARPQRHGFIAATSMKRAGYGHRGRMMRRAERPFVGERAAFDLASDGSDHRHFEQFGRCQRRQSIWSAAAPPASTCQRSAGRSSVGLGSPESCLKGMAPEVRFQTKAEKWLTLVCQLMTQNGH